MQIRIKDLKILAIIGILDFERKTPQDLVVNFWADYDFKDNIFIDYSKIASFIEKNLKSQKFGLLEDALTFLEKGLQNSFNIKNLRLELSKPNILKNCEVSINNFDKF